VSKLTLDLIENWLSKNLNDSLLGGMDGLDIRGIATYQPSDGLLDLKVVTFSYLQMFFYGVGYVLILFSF
jgi:aminotransferase